MQDSRTRGLLLLALGTLIFGLNLNEMLPPQVFWGGLAASILGLVSFMKGNRAAIERAERRTAQSLHPSLQNRRAHAFAERQAVRDVDRGVAAQAMTSRPAAASARDAIELEVDGGGESDSDDVQISSDVSFPLEIQRESSIADQLAKLVKLHEAGVLSAEELQVAKTKLLG